MEPNLQTSMVESSVARLTEIATSLTDTSHNSIESLTDALEYVRNTLAMVASITRGKTDSDTMEASKEILKLVKGSLPSGSGRSSQSSSKASNGFSNEDLETLQTKYAEVRQVYEKHRGPKTAVTPQKKRMTTYGEGREGPPVSLAEFVGNSSSPSAKREGKNKHRRPSKLRTFFRGGAKGSPFGSPVKAEAGSSDPQASPTQLILTRKDGQQKVRRRPTQ